jgi:hypothetical protein
MHKLLSKEIFTFVTFSPTFWEVKLNSSQIYDYFIKVHILEFVTLAQPPSNELIRSN